MQRPSDSPSPSNSYVCSLTSRSGESPGTPVSPTSTIFSSTSSPSNQDENWHLHFNVPEISTFGFTVGQGMKTGKVTSTIRRKIVGSLRTLILQHTQYPTSEQYTTVCRKLVDKYPKLKDTVGPDIGSWKFSLRTAMKNFRRDHDPKVGRKRNISGNEPPSKRGRVLSEEECEMTVEEYQEAIADMQSEFEKGKKRNKIMIQRLLDATRKPRREWIINDNPHASEIFEMFPALGDSRMFRREFCLLVGINGPSEGLSGWIHWADKIYEGFKLEAQGRTGLSKLLDEHDNVAEDIHHENDYKDFHILKMLEKLLFPRGITASKKSYLFLHIMTKDIDIEEEVKASTSQSEPLLVIVGKVGVDAEIFIYMEG